MDASAFAIRPRVVVRTSRGLITDGVEAIPTGRGTGHFCPVCGRCCLPRMGRRGVRWSFPAVSGAMNCVSSFSRQAETGSSALPCCSSPGKNRFSCPKGRSRPGEKRFSGLISDTGRGKNRLESSTTASWQGETGSGVMIRGSRPAKKAWCDVV